jgi:DNA modification methylase
MPDTNFDNLTPNSDWSFINTTRLETNYLTHGYHRYPAKFIPNIVQKLINDYTQPGSLIVDPFGGCGTTLVEAKISGRKSIGIDINPIAKLITDIKTKPIDPKKLKKFNAIFLKSYLTTPEVPPTFKTDRLDYWFEKETQIKLNRIYSSIKTIKDPYIRKFYFVAFSHILKNCSKWLMKSIKPQVDKSKSTKDPFTIFKLHLKFMIQRNSEFYTLLEKNGFLNLSCKMKIANTAKKVPIKSASVDFVITSPPYVTSYEYADLHQLSLLWFGSDEKYFKSWGKLVKDFTGFKKQFIGTSFSKDVDLKSLNSQTAQQIVTNLKEKDRGDALNVAGYYSDINKSFIELYRILKKGAKSCVIIGNTSLKGVEILNAEVVLEQLENLGFKKVEIIKREIGTKIITSWRNTETGRFSGSSDKGSKRVYQYEYLLIVEK